MAIPSSTYPPHGRSGHAWGRKVLGPKRWTAPWPKKASYATGLIVIFFTLVMFLFQWKAVLNYCSLGGSTVAL